MNNSNKLIATLSGAIIAVINFALFLISTQFILETTVELKNIVAFAFLSILIGLISFALYFFKPKIAFTLFIAGLIAGFIFMINTYSKQMDGWGDLIGLLTFFMLSLAGLISGLIIQLIVYLIRRSKNLSTKTK